MSDELEAIERNHIDKKNIRSIFFEVSQQQGAGGLTQYLLWSAVVSIRHGFDHAYCN